MLQLDNPRHAAAVERLLNSGSDYITYWSVIHSEKALLNRCLVNWEPAIWQYIAEYTGHHHTGSQPSLLNLEQLYGELVIRVTFKAQSWTVKLFQLLNHFMYDTSGYQKS